MKKAVYGLLTLAGFAGIAVSYFYLAEKSVLLTVACSFSGAWITLFAGLVISTTGPNAEKLAKVPEIARLIDEAESRERQVEIAKKNLADLEKLVARESRRLFLEKELRNLEHRLLELTSEYEKLESEIKANEQPLEVDPDFEKRVGELIEFVRSRRQFKEQLWEVQTGNVFADFLLDLLKLVSAKGRN